MWWWRLTTLALLPASVWSLSCYICGDNNLDEFGECSTQFQYDCQSYASRFPRDETIYCRTTRHKAPNNTYTVMKECISEQDHYKTFPNKGYAIDEECDLVVVKDEEIAYCICRSHNFCNKASIADQFTAFEERNPELFGDVDMERSGPAHNSPSDLLPVLQPGKINFVAPPVPLPPIVPVNDLRVNAPGIESEIRRAHLPTRAKTINFSAPPDGFSSLPEEPQGSFLAGQGNFIGSGSTNHHAVAVPSSPVTGKLPTEATGLRCSQCGESDLPSENSDCSRQVVVNCIDSDAVCFTRQILIGRDRAAIEKMCVSWQAVKSEFPLSSMNSCGEASQGRVRYCTCATNGCNSIAISLQIADHSQTEALPQFVKTGPPASMPPLDSPDLEAKSPSTTDNLSVVHPHGASLSEHGKISSDLMSSREPLVKNGESLPVVEPVKKLEAPGGKSVAELNNGSPRSWPLGSSRDAIELINSQKSLLKCSVCLDSGIADPTADCSSSTPAHCSEHETFCLTRQTQNEDATFTMEKRCVSMALAMSLVESSDVRTGCATTKGGLINYCLCHGDLCNREALLAQAQIAGVRNLESSPKPMPSAIQELSMKIEPFKLPTTNIPLVFVDGDEPPHAETSHSPETRLIDDDRELMIRQKAWAEADLKASSRCPPIFLAMIGVLMML